MSRPLASALRPVDGGIISVDVQAVTDLSALVLVVVCQAWTVIGSVLLETLESVVALCMEVLRVTSLHLCAKRPCASPRPRPGSRKHVRLNAHVAPRERVLRYPDGHERRIIYPAIMTLDEDDDDPNSWDVTGLWTGSHQQQQQVLALKQVKPSQLEAWTHKLCMVVS